MNQKLNNQTKQINIQGDDTMQLNQNRTQIEIIGEETTETYLNINFIKKRVQKGVMDYIIGVKLVTTEDSEIVLKTLKKDLRIYSNINRFIIKDNTIKVNLDNNATLYVYYFLNNKILEEVLEELPSLGKEVINLTETIK